MNKAFTANINDQVTARGYLDENDQLVMLEPEGSGGGGLTTAKLTVILNDGVVAPPPADFAYYVEGSVKCFNGMLLDAGVYELLLGVDGFMVIDLEPEYYTITGNAEDVGRDGIKYTGDFTITVLPVETDAGGN